MAKFKVGDKVRVKKDLVVGNRYDDFVRFSSAMTKYYGEVFTIKSEASWSGSHTYYVVENDFLWVDNMLEPYTFTKADLKDGMVVEYANGERRLFCNNVFMSEYAMYSDLIDFNDDLTCCRKGYEKEFTINKVYDTAGKSFDSVFKDYKLTLIWERPEEECKEMTVEEIEKILGHKVKVVGDKNG